MVKVYRYRIRPNKSQEIAICNTLDACRLVYNLALEVKIDAYKRHGKHISGVDLCNQLPDLKRGFAWLNSVNSQSLQSSIRKLDVSFSNFYKGGGHPKFLKKTNRQSFECPGNNRFVSFDGNYITVPKIHKIPAIIDRRFSGVIKTVFISKTVTGKYFASIVVDNGEVDPIKTNISSCELVGIDLGIKSFVVTSNGNFFEPNRKLKDNISRLKCLNKRASRKKKGSNNRGKANKRVALLHEKIVNQRTDYIHKVTTGLIRDNQAGAFVMEDLNVTGMLKNRKLSQAISDVSFGEFKRQMKYKCDWYGKNLLFIGRFEPSSKTCSCCGAKNETLTLKDREWVCPSCGTLHDRDLNAAKNIRQIGLNNISGVGSPGEPVEKRRLRRSKKQEGVLV